MNKREPITKKMRFEVFKRDKFTCQYCGRMAPDVVLEVDHINPVSEGGETELINLITSCRDCNRGKGKTRLSDNTAVKKQQKMLKDLADKNEQLEMMIKWKDELLAFDAKKADVFADYLSKQYMVALNESGYVKVKIWLKEFTVQELIVAADEAFKNTFHKTTDDAFNEIPKIAYYNKNPTSPEVKQIMYLRKILINRLGCRKDRLQTVYEAIGYLLFERNVDYETLKSICCTCSSWKEFAEMTEEFVV